MRNFATQSTPNPARFAKLTTIVESDHCDATATNNVDRMSPARVRPQNGTTSPQNRLRSFLPQIQYRLRKYDGIEVIVTEKMFAATPLQPSLPCVNHSSSCVDTVPKIDTVT